MHIKSLFIVLLLAIVSFSNEGAGQRIGKKVDKAVADVSEYTQEQKEKIQKEFQEQLDNIDREIIEIRARGSYAKESATESSKKQINDQIEFLEKRRSELKTDYDKLKKSSGKAWDRIKEGFQSSVSTLKESFLKAKQEFHSESQK